VYIHHRCHWKMPERLNQRLQQGKSARPLTVLVLGLLDGLPPLVLEVHALAHVATLALGPVGLCVLSRHSSQCCELAVLCVCLLVNSVLVTGGGVALRSGARAPPAVASALAGGWVDTGAGRWDGVAAVALRWRPLARGGVGLEGVTWADIVVARACMAATVTAVRVRSTKHSSKDATMVMGNLSTPNKQRAHKRQD
jgi:hypothetical protein